METKGNRIPLNRIPFKGILFPFPFADHTNGILKAVQPPTDLLLNYLIASTVNQGRPVQVPEGTEVQEVPQALFSQERKILAAARIDDYEATAVAL